jgi:hypothetical protein
MTNAVRDAFAEAQRQSAENDNQPFMLAIKLSDGTTVTGLPYPIEPQAGEAVRITVDPTEVGKATKGAPSAGDRWISALAIVAVGIQWGAATKPAGTIAGGAGSAGGVGT